jgi:hypothetical protein
MNFAQRLATAIGLAGTIVLVAKVGGCSSTEVPSAAPSPTDSGDCGGLVLGQEKVEQCPVGTSGTRTYICTEKGLKIALDGCSPPNGGGGGGGGNGGGGGGNGGNSGGGRDCRVSFEQVKPILTNNCVSCHSSPTRLDEYGTARAWAVKTVARINLADQDSRRMPLPPRPPLSASDKALLKTWTDEGTPETCEKPGQGNGGGGPARVGLDFHDVERAVLVDLQTRVDSSDRGDTVYLVTADRWDEGDSEGDLENYERALNKTLNSVNPRGTDITLVEPVPGTNETVWRVNITDFEIDNVKFKVLTDADKLPIASQTDDGAVIKTLSGRNQTIFMASNFMQLAMSAGPYHAFTELPAKLSQYFVQLGVNFAGEIADLDNVTYTGATTSPITNLKNRLFVRVNADGFNAGTGRGKNAYFYQTFDTLPAQPIANRNLFTFPLLAGTGGNSVKNFRFDASETIASLPNGLQAYGLWDAAGNRLDFALLEVVRDTSSPIDATIRNGNSCSRCHNAGLIPMVDQIRDHVVRNSSQFPVNDVRLVQSVYRPQSVQNKNLAADQGAFAAALAKMGINPAEPDPQSHVFDEFFLDWDLKTVCGYLLIPSLDQCRSLLDQSATARAEIGQILTGGVVTFENFKDVYLKLVDEMALFQDDL